MQNGGRVDWIGTTLFDLEPSPFISTMPAFPETNVNGIITETREGPCVFAEGLWGYTSGYEMLRRAVWTRKDIYGSGVKRRR